MSRLLILCSFYIVVTSGFSQGEFNNWMFGQNNSLNFNITPPSSGTSAINSNEACASVSNGTGGLLFYTDGVTVWNNQHSIMANGSGLTGGQSTSQGAIIVSRPGSATQYFVVTLDAAGGANGLKYSVVDMSLAAGLGSVTAKNLPIYGQSSEKLAVVPQCNRKDYWLISQSFLGFDFRVFPITSAGISTAAVVSSFPNGGNLYYPTGSIKLSHDLRRLVNVTASFSVTLTTGFDLYDFDNSTGIVSNQKPLYKVRGAYSAEFSSDDTRLYGTSAGNNGLYQWDLCHDSLVDIQNSRTTLWTSSLSPGHVQEGPDGKIYMAVGSQSYLAVINSPNSPGSASNFVLQGCPLSGLSLSGLPSRVRLPSPVPTPTYSPGPGCATSFSTQALSGTLSACYSPAMPFSALWNFGDSLSVSSNTSAALNPVHHYSSGGTYTASVIRNYGCYTDTVKFTVNINHVPVISVTGKTTVCVNEQLILVASGSTTYTWSTGLVSPTLVTTATASGLNSYTVSASTPSLACVTKTIVNVDVSNCLALSEGSSLPYRIFPNPAQNILVIESNEVITLQISNTLGKVLKTQEISAGKSLIQIEELKPGHYVLMTITPTGVRHYLRFVKTI